MSSQIVFHFKGWWGWWASILSNNPIKTDKELRPLTVTSVKPKLILAHSSVRKNTHHWVTPLHWVTCFWLWKKELQILPTTIILSLSLFSFLWNPRGCKKRGHSEHLEFYFYEFMTFLVRNKHVTHCSTVAHLYIFNSFPTIKYTSMYCVLWVSNKEILPRTQVRVTMLPHLLIVKQIFCCCGSVNVCYFPSTCVFVHTRVPKGNSKRVSSNTWCGVGLVVPQISSSLINTSESRAVHSPGPSWGREKKRQI